MALCALRLVDVLDILFFSARGRGRGSPRRQEGAGVGFVIENPRRARGLEGVCGIFFLGPKFPARQGSESQNSQTTTGSDRCSQETAGICRCLQQPTSLVWHLPFGALLSSARCRANLTENRMQTLQVIDSVNFWSIVFFPVLKPLAFGRQSQCLGWIYKLPGGQKFSIKLSPLSVGFPQRRPLNLITRPRIINSPGVRFINHPACNL